LSHALGKLVVASGWHLRQTTSRLALISRPFFGSSGFPMSWIPWQSKQTGSFVAWSGCRRSNSVTVDPWKSATYVRYTAVDRPYFAIFRLSVWHFAHMWGEARRNSGVRGFDMLWTPWQSMQVGTSGLPLMSADPWTL
jgi:hypothetical protein